MQAIAGEIQIVIAITLLVLLITSFVIIFMFIHQRQYHHYLKDKEKLKNTYQQELLKAQLEMKEQTLHNVSQEIHDNIGQILSLVKLNLNTVVVAHTKEAAEKITMTKDLVGKAIQDLRNLSKTLNTAHIHTQKLSESLQFELKLIEKTGMYQTDFQVNGTEERIDGQKQLIVFRIAQEVLQNIIKHAKAHHIRINLEYLPKLLKLHIKDDGIGFDISRNIPMEERGTGITNMFHRAKLIGADLSINSRQNEGTIMILSLPM